MGIKLPKRTKKEEILSNIGLCLFFLGLLVIAIIPLANCPEYAPKENTNKTDEVVKQVNFQHSFMGGDYCTIVTDKNFYSTNNKKDCIENKIGKKYAYTTTVYEKVK